MAGVVLSGVSPSSIGNQYDFALGYDPGNGQVKMVGYVLKPGTGFQESTDIQDSEHLVQITATNNADRFTRYPKSSQGDWSGGERQVFSPGGGAATNAYYNSDGNINTLVPGNLALFNGMSIQQLSLGAVFPNSFPVAATNSKIWASIGGGISPKNLAWISNITNAITSIPVGDGSAVQGMCSPPNYQTLDEVVVGLADGGGTANQTGVLAVNTAGTVVAQLSNDGVVNGPSSMVYVNGNVYYITGTAPQTIRHEPATTTGNNATGILDVTVSGGDNFITFLAASEPLLIYGTGGVTSTLIHTWDGSTSTTIGSIPGSVIGVGNANGIVYLLCILIQGVSQTTVGYAIYQIDGTAVSVFDDLRPLPSVFQAQFPIGTQRTGGLASDGQFLYAAIPGMGLRAYNLTIPGNPVSQIMPILSPGVNGTVANVNVVVSNNSGGSGPFFFMIDGSVKLSIAQQSAALLGVASSGKITSSLIDFSAPTVVKSWRSIDIEMVTPLQIVDPSISQAGGVFSTQIAMTVTVDNGQPIIPIPNLGGVGGLIDKAGNTKFPLPPGTKGYRLQYTLQLFTNAASTPPTPLSPIVRSISVKGTLGRAWTLTAACYRAQRTRSEWGGGEDTQGLTAQQKLANIVNSYLVAAGNVYMYIPSSTITTSTVFNLPGSTGGVQNSVTCPPGVEMVTATLEDYQQLVKGEPGPYQTEYGSQDMEADVQLILTEAL